MIKSRSFLSGFYLFEFDLLSKFNIDKNKCVVIIIANGLLIMIKHANKVLI